METEIQLRKMKCSGDDRGDACTKHMYLIFTSELYAENKSDGKFYVMHI